MPKDRHRGTRISAYLTDATTGGDEFERFERQTPNCKTMKEAILKLVETSEEKAEGENKKTRTLRTKVKTLEIQLGKLFDDFYKAEARIEELKKQLEEEKRLREEQEQLSKIQPQLKTEIKEVVKEVPKYVEKTVEKTVEKIVYKEHPLANLQIKCILGKGYVSIAEECLRKCQDIADCPYYTSIAVEKKIPQGAKLKI